MWNQNRVKATYWKTFGLIADPLCFFCHFPFPFDVQSSFVSAVIQFIRGFLEKRSSVVGNQWIYLFEVYAPRMLFSVKSRVFNNLAVKRAMFYCKQMRT